MTKKKQDKPAVKPSGGGNRSALTTFALDDARDLDKASIMTARGYVLDPETGKWR